MGFVPVYKNNGSMCTLFGLLVHRIYLYCKESKKVLSNNQRRICSFRAIVDPKANLIIATGSKLQNSTMAICTVVEPKLLRELQFKMRGGHSCDCHFHGLSQQFLIRQPEKNTKKKSLPTLDMHPSKNRYSSAYYCVLGYNITVRAWRAVLGIAFYYSRVVLVPPPLLNTIFI